MKKILKALLRYTPYRVVHANLYNRFDAVDEVLVDLRRRGFAPTHVIDAGANVGSFALKARRTFKDAVIDLVEPQPACYPALQRLERKEDYFFHPFALVADASPGQRVKLAVDADAVSTGAHITFDAHADTVEVQAATLDSLLADRLRKDDKIFLKLDLQGYELEALAGAERTLQKTEVILTEVSFYAQAYEPPISKLVDFLDERGFSLYDIAALSSRPRDGRARQGDFVFVHRDSALMADSQWS